MCSHLIFSITVSTRQMTTLYWLLGRCLLTHGQLVTAQCSFRITSSFSSQGQRCTNQVAACKLYLGTTANSYHFKFLAANTYKLKCSFVNNCHSKYSLLTLTSPNVHLLAPTSPNVRLLTLISPRFPLSPYTRPYIHLLTIICPTF